MDSKLRVIVAGSRVVEDYKTFREKFLKRFGGMLDNIEVITGRAKHGVDDMAYHLAKWDLNLAYAEFPAKWDEYGKRAGFVRNEEMADYATDLQDSYLFLMWDGISKGSKHMFNVATENELHKVVYVVDPCPMDDYYVTYDFTNDSTE